MWHDIRDFIRIGSLMLGVYLMGLYFTYIYPAFELFIGMSPLMHMLGGLVTAFTIDQLYHRFGGRWGMRIEPVGLYGVLLVTLTVCVGVDWEIFEYLQDRLLGTVTQLGIGDALLDLTMDTVGAVLYCLFFLVTKPKKGSPKERRRVS